MKQRLAFVVAIMAQGMVPTVASARPCFPTMEQLEALRAKAETQGRGAKVVPPPLARGEQLRPPVSKAPANREPYHLKMVPCRNDDLGLSQ